WGRPAADLERAVAMAHRVETEGLRRNVATLRRVAAPAAVLGGPGAPFRPGRGPGSIPPPTAHRPALPPPPAAPGPAPAPPRSAGRTAAPRARGATAGGSRRAEKPAGALDRLGAETIEAIAMPAPPAATPIAMARSPHLAKPRTDEGSPAARGKA